MANKIIDATLRFVDKFSSPMNEAMSSLSRHAKTYQRIGKDIQKTGESISNAGSKLTTGITAPVLAAGIASFKLASDLSESLNKVQVAFGNNSKEVEDWSKTTLTSYGIAQGSALDMAATFGDMGTGMGLSTSAASEMSRNLVGLAGDLSSFKNISGDVAKTALNGIFTGETESLKGLGIIMTQANLNQYALANGYGKTIDKMSQAEQVQLRYAYVMNATKNAQGDFARTSSGAANQMRIFTEGVKQLGASLGSFLLPYGTKLISMGNSIVSKFNAMSDKQKDLIVKTALMAAAIGPAVLMFGKMVTGVGKVVSIAGKLGSAFKTAGSVMGLLTSPAGIVIAVLAALVVAGILVYKNWDKIKATAIKLGATIKSVFNSSGESASNFKEKFQMIGEKFGELKQKGSELFTALQPILSKIGDLAQLYFKVYFGTALGAVIGLFNSLLHTATSIIGALMTIFSGLIDFFTGVFTGNWSKALTGISEIFKGVFDGLIAIAKAPINAVIGIINGMVSQINSMGITIPDWVPGIGGKSFSISMPTLNYLYTGTQAWMGGLAAINDRGGEIVDLPRGTRVYPHDESVQMARQEGQASTGKNIVITVAKLAESISVREEADINKIVEALATKLEQTALNMGAVIA